MSAARDVYEATCSACGAPVRFRYNADSSDSFLGTVECPACGEAVDIARAVYVEGAQPVVSNHAPSCAELYTMLQRLADQMDQLQACVAQLKQRAGLRDPGEDIAAADSRW